jgi:hypothetical protein
MNYLTASFVLCSIASAALLFSIALSSYIKRELLWFVRLAIGIALIGLGTAGAVQTFNRDHQTASIQSRLDKLKIRQAEIKSRFDALVAEASKAPRDPVVLREFGARHLELVRESETSKTELGEIQKELDAHRQ